MALVSRELWPFGGGGIGRYVAETATLLAATCDVTILTGNEHARALADARSAGDPRAVYGGARVALVTAPGPGDTGGFTSPAHLYAARVMDRLRELYPEGGPEVVEAGDFLGEAAVVVQARRAGDPLLAATTVLVRLHTSGELAAVLNGFAAEDRHTRAVFALERLALRDADGLLVADPVVLEAYRRLYGVDALAPAATVRHPFGIVDERRGRATASVDPPTPAPVAADDGAPPLSILCVGRLERRKGQDDLVEALLGIPARWRLTLAGADTPTGPLGTSVESLVHQRAGGDPRVQVLGHRSQDAVTRLLAEHDLLVVPSRWECWPYVVLEALRAGVPVLAVDAGGPARMADAAAGFLAASGNPADLRRALLPLVEDPAAVRRLRGAGPRARAAALAEPAPIAAAYAARATPAAGPGRSPRSRRPPLVSIVVPYHGLPEHVEATVASALTQTHARIELLVVNDGSFAPEDRVLARLAARYPLTVLTQPNRGLGSARNLGIGQARGRFVVPLDADNVLEPEFVERCLDVLLRDPDCAYATSWTRYVDERGESLAGGVIGYQPLGNGLGVDGEQNVAGDAVALLPRRTFDHLRYDPALTSYEDWSLYRRLAGLGLRGRVVPERLVRYRVRAGSLLRAVGLPNDERLRAELRTADRRDAIA